jgi:pimeloyl-ACP methyl ester carboxylesterase
VTIVASGLGGGLSVLLASQHPEVVKQLVLWMPTGLTELGALPVPMGRRIASMMPLAHRFVYRNYESSRPAVRNWLEINGFSDASRITEETLDVYATCAQQYGAEHAIRNLYAGRLNVDLEGRLPLVSQPVTLLWPEETGAGHVELPARLQALARGSRLRIAPRFSQLAAVEGPGEIAALLAEELDPRLKVVR